MREGPGPNVRGRRGLVIHHEPHEGMASRAGAVLRNGDRFLTSILFMYSKGEPREILSSCEVRYSRMSPISHERQERGLWASIDALRNRRRKDSFDYSGKLLK